MLRDGQGEVGGVARERLGVSLQGIMFPWTSHNGHLQ
jgi:hypothetical protein